MRGQRTGALERYVFDLSSTEWPVWPHSEVMNAAIYTARGCVNRYPDHTAGEVRELLAARHRLEPEQIVLGNGAGDLLQTTALALLSRGDELVTPWPSYPLYPLMTRRAGARPVPVPLTDGHIDPTVVLRAVSDRTHALAVCNPNDPTGTYLPSESLAELVSALPQHVCVLLDEALVHFQDREEEDACLRLVERFERLLVFRSFSNVYGLSGLRAGYVVGSRAAAPLLDTLAPVLGVNRMTQAAVQYTLERGERELTKRRATVLAERRRLKEALAALPFEAPESQAHFVWLRAEGMSGGQLVAALERAGVIAFPGSVLGEDDHVRLSLCSPAATDRLLSVLPGIATFCADHGAAVTASRESVA